MEDTDSYVIGKDTQWRDTLEDGIIMFTGARPAIAEQVVDAKSSKGASESSKYDLWEANWIKTLKGDTALSIVSSKLYYYPKTKAIYNVIEVKKNDSDQPIYVRMLKHKLSDEIVLDDQNEINTLRDYVNINIKIHSEASNDIINTQVKLQNKLENELADPIRGSTGKTLSMFKLFRDSKVVDKDSFLSSFDNIEDDIFIFATTGLSKSSTFKRFNPINYNRYWSSNGRNLDAITFIPNQNVIFGGFSLFASYDVPKFEAKYWIYVDNNLVEDHSDIITWSDFEDTHFFRITTKNFIEVKAGSKLEVTALIANSFSGEPYISQYYGTDGYDFAKVENEHMGLWTVEYSPRSQDTSLGYGNFPEIFYYL